MKPWNQPDQAAQSAADNRSHFLTQDQQIDAEMKFWDQLDERIDEKIDESKFDQTYFGQVDRAVIAEKSQPQDETIPAEGSFWDLLADPYDLALSEASHRETQTVSPEALSELVDRRVGFTAIREASLLDRLSLRSLVPQKRFWFWTTALLSSLALYGTTMLTGESSQSPLMANSLITESYVTDSPAANAAATPAKSTAPAAARSRTAPAPQAAPQAMAQSEATILQQAQELIDRAKRLSQSAQSIDDWRLVVSQWQQSIAKLNAISRSSASYSAARQQLQTIQSQLAAAQRQAKQPVTEIPSLSTPNLISLAASCPSRPVNISVSGNANGGANSGANGDSNAIANPAASPVELTNAAFQQADANVETPIVGCITNNTNQLIRNVSLIYKGTSAQTPSLLRTGSEAVIAEVKPGETIGFQSQFTVSPEISDVEIQTISWQVADNPEPQMAPLTVQLTR